MPGLRIFKGAARGPPSGSARPHGAGIPVKKAPCRFCSVAGPCPRMKEVKSYGVLSHVSGHSESHCPLLPRLPSACCLSANPSLSFCLSLPHPFSPFHFVSFLSLVPLPLPILQPFTLFLFSLCLSPHVPPTFPGLQLPGTQSKLSGNLQVLTFNCDSWKPLGLGMETHRTLSQACTGRLCLQPGLPPLSQAHSFPAAFWLGHFAAETGHSQTRKSPLISLFLSKKKTRARGGEVLQGFPWITHLMRGKVRLVPDLLLSLATLLHGEKPDVSEAWTDSFLSWRPADLTQLGKITSENDSNGISLLTVG